MIASLLLTVPHRAEQPRDHRGRRQGRRHNGRLAACATTSVSATVGHISIGRHGPHRRQLWPERHDASAFPDGRPRTPTSSANPPTSIALGAYLTYCKQLIGIGRPPTGTMQAGCGFEFGVGDNDMSRSSRQHGDAHPHRLDRHLAARASASYGRTGIDGTGLPAQLSIRTPGLSNVWTVMISEVADKGNAGDVCNDQDYIELQPDLQLDLDWGDMLSDDHGHGWIEKVLGATGCPSRARRGRVHVDVPPQPGSSSPARRAPFICRRRCSRSTCSIGGGDKVQLYLDASATHTKIDETVGGLADNAARSWGRMSPTTW